MKTTLKIGFAAIIIASTMFSSCGKYEDGPKISLATKKGRLCRAWTVESFVDGATKIEVPCTVGCGNTEYLKDGSIMNNGLKVTGFTWQFSSDKKKLEIVFGSITSSDEIIRLTGSELWLRDISSKDETHYKAL